MQINDGRGKQVNVGLTVRYGGTGTTGEVSAVKLDGDEGWVQIDHSEIWYNSESLEVMSKNNIKSKKNSSKEFNPAQTVEKSKNKSDLSDVSMGTGTCDGGG
jgi:hypothetical protein